ncbi:Nif3-like dinuclear metal center hexameric protein [Candidatus Pyrohabitans sp.]
MRLKELVEELDSLLKLEEFPGDESANGLQVAGREEVKKVALAVDACSYVFEQAAKLGADFIFVHHGLIWGGVKSIRGTLRNRLRLLLEKELSLYACHLPLDAHPELGNNAQLLKLLGIERRGEFGEYHGRRIGYWGELPQRMSVAGFAALVEERLATRCRLRDFSGYVKRVGVVSGGGWSAIFDAEKIKVDTLLTGEPSHSACSLAEELGVNLIFAGHYDTEKLGVLAVGEHLRGKLALETVFIDHDTGL